MDDWNDNMEVCKASSESSKPKRFVRRYRKKLKESIFTRTIPNLIPLLQPEHVFCQQNGLERG